MSNLSGSDVAILVVAAYISIVTLVRLMRRRRDEVVSRYQIQVAAEQQRKRVEERREKQRRSREQQARIFSPTDESDETAA